MSDIAAPKPPTDIPEPAPLKPSQRQAALVFIFITLALDMLALGVMVPVLPRLIVDFQGGDEANAAHWVGLFGTIWAASQFVFMPILGALSDVVGRRPIILISNFGTAADYVVMALAPTLWWLMVGRIISGITSASVSTAFAYVADVTAPEKRAASFGMLSAAFGLGFVIGPAVGGTLGDVDPRLPFWVAAGLSALNGLYGLFVLPESLPRERRALFSWRKANPVGAFALLREQSGLLTLAFVKMLNDFAHVVYPATFALYAFHRYGWGSKEVGWTLALVGVAGIAVQAGLVRVIVKKIGERRTLILGLSCGVMGFALYGLAQEWWILLYAIPIAALWGMAGPSGQALMSRRVTASEQGRLQGALSSVQGIAGMIGPTIFTGVFAYFISGAAPAALPGAALFTAALAVGLSLPLAIIATRNEPAAPEGGAAAPVSAGH